MGSLLFLKITGDARDGGGKNTIDTIFRHIESFHASDIIVYR